MDNDVDRSRVDRIVGADGLRAAAALAVILSHIYQRLNPMMQQDWYQQVQWVLMKGAFGVSVFFVLSGMLLSFPFWRAYLAGEPMPNLRHFARRRAARIVPGYYVSLIVSFILAFWLTPDADHKVWRLIAGLTFTSDFHYVTFFPSPVNGPLWSISFEVFSYVLLALMMAAFFWWAKRRAASKAGDDAGPRRGGALRAGLYWAGVFALVLVLNGLIVSTISLSDEGKGWDFGDIGGAKEWMPGYNPLGFFAHFLLGILAGWAIAAWRARQRRRHADAGASELTRWWWDAVAVAGLAGAAALVWFNRLPAEPNHLDNFQQQPYLFPWFPLAIAVALMGLAHSRWLGRVVDNRFARYTATISFGLYIWHYLLLYLLSYVTEGRFEYFGIFSWGQHLALGGILLAISYGMAALSWRWIEKPALTSRWANRR